MVIKTTMPIKKNMFLFIINEVFNENVRAFNCINYL